MYVCICVFQFILPFLYSGVLSSLTMGVFLACCVLNLVWTVASTKYCELSRTMNELMKKLRSLKEKGLRKGNLNFDVLYQDWING